MRAIAGVVLLAWLGACSDPATDPDVDAGPTIVFSEDFADLSGWTLSGLSQFTVDASDGDPAPSIVCASNSSCIAQPFVDPWETRGTTSCVHAQFGSSFDFAVLFGGVIGTASVHVFQGGVIEFRIGTAALNGAPLTVGDPSWHTFCLKVAADGAAEWRRDGVLQQSGNLESGMRLVNLQVASSVGSARLDTVLVTRP